MIPITRPVLVWARSGDPGTVDGVNIGRASCCGSAPLPVLTSPARGAWAAASFLPSVAVRGEPDSAPEITVSQPVAFANGVSQGN